MVVTLILVRDEREDMHDQEGDLRNAADQRIDAQGAAIPEYDTDATGTTLPVDEAALPRTLADYNRTDHSTPTDQPFVLQLFRGGILS